MTISKKKLYLKILVKNNQFEDLEKIFEPLIGGKKGNDLLLILGRLKSLQLKKAKGTIKAEDESTELNKIKDGLFQFIDYEIPDDLFEEIETLINLDKKEKTILDAEDRKNISYRTVLSLLTISFMMILFVMSYFISYRNESKPISSSNQILNLDSVNLNPEKKDSIINPKKRDTLIQAKNILSFHPVSHGKDSKPEFKTTYIAGQVTGRQVDSVKIWVELEGHLYKTQSDLNGRYRLKNIPIEWSNKPVALFYMASDMSAPEKITVNVGNKAKNIIIY